MAYLAQDQDEESKTQGQQGEDPNAPTILSSPGAAAPTNSTNPNNTAGDGAPAPAKTSSGSFTNLQKYITANTGNDAAMGGAVQNNAQGKATEADTKGAGWQQAAAKKVQDNTVTDNGVLGALDTVTKGGAASTIDKDAFGRAYNASYEGPKAANRGNDVEGFDDTLGSFDKVQKYGQLANGDFADRGALLKDTYGTAGNQYNGGERRLDSFILGSGKSGTDALKNVGDTYGNYADDKFGKLRDAIGAQAQAAETTTNGTRDAVRAASDSALGGLEGRFASAAEKAAATSAAESAKYKAITDAKDPAHVAALKAAGMDDATINFLTSNKGDFARLAGAGKDFSAGDYADANDVGNYKSLLDLLGGVNSGKTGKYAETQLGKTGAATSVNSDLIGTAKTAAGLNNTLANALLDKKRAENGKYADARYVLKHLGGFGARPTSKQMFAVAADLGVEAQDLYDASTMGIDLTKFLHEGSGNYGYGDVDDAKASDYGRLAALLGIQADTGHHGGAGHSFDNGDFAAALAAARAAHPRAAAEAAPPPIQKTVLGEIADPTAVVVDAPSLHPGPTIVSGGDLNPYSGLSSGGASGGQPSGEAQFDAKSSEYMANKGREKFESSTEADGKPYTDPNENFKKLSNYVGARV